MSEMTEREVLVSLRDVEISFDNGGKTKFKAVQDANFDIYKGETFALVGESGSGKTTIGRAIMRINELSKGEITLKDMQTGEQRTLGSDPFVSFFTEK